MPRFLEHICDKYEFANSNIVPATSSIKFDPIIANVLSMYQSSISAKRPALLSLVASQLSYKTLIEYGFNISQTQPSEAKRINCNGSTTLEDYTRTMPPS